MMNRDYTKEVGIDSGEKVVPWPYAIALLVIFAIGVGCGIWLLREHAGKSSEPKPVAPSASLVAKPDAWS